MSAHQSRRDQERQRELVQRRRSPSGRRHTFPVSAKTTPEQIIRHVERFIIPVREVRSFYFDYIHRKFRNLLQIDFGNIELERDLRRQGFLIPTLF